MNFAHKFHPCIQQFSLVDHESVGVTPLNSLFIPFSYLKFGGIVIDLYSRNMLALKQIQLAAIMGNDKVKGT